MAEKVKEEQKKNRVVEFILTEHKIENYLLLFLGIFAIELGVILLRGLADSSKALLIIPDTAWLIGGALKTKIFSWILVALGVISIVLVASSFYRPSFDEIKHIKGLKKKEFFWNVIKVVCFSIILALFFVLCEFLIKLVIQAIGNLLYK
jgi:hypothetical protein